MTSDAANTPISMARFTSQDHLTLRFVLQNRPRVTVIDLC